MELESLKFIGIGLNFKDHAEEQNLPIPKEPIIFSKFTSCITGPNDPIIVPKGSTHTDWEVELGFVIGKKGVNISTDQALDHVLGFFLVNDVSERNFQKNKGLNATNNVAIDLAQGKYIMRLDADDFLENSAVGVMVALLEADDSLGLVFPDYYYVDVDGKVTGQERRHHFDDEVTLYDQPAHGACTLVRLEFLKELGGYDESFSCQDGYELWIKFTTFHKITNISRPLFYYRRHGNNLTTNEKRILDTRKAIKSKFVEKYSTILMGIAIIPVRSTMIGEVNWPLLNIVNGVSVVQNKVDVCLKVKYISKVIIVTSEINLFEFYSLEMAGNSKVEVVLRPLELAGKTVTLSETVRFIDQIFESKIKYDFIATVAIEYPFLESSTIEEAVNTLSIYKADSVISVRPEYSTFYSHDGNSLRPILDQDKKTKYEREAIYKGVGGVVVCSVNSFRKNKLMLGNRTSHIQLDQKNSFSVTSEFELNLFKNNLSNA